MGRTVLVVDDDPVIVEIVKQQLEERAYEVLTAGSGEEGLRKCQLRTPDAVILDIMMPDMSGAEVAEAMKEDPTTCNIPVIFITGLIKDEEVPKVEVPGGPRYLAKPFKSEDLLALLRQVLNR